MRQAYNETWLHNLQLVKEAKRWMKQRIITTEQFVVINNEYVSKFYHPNIVIRILLFIATLFALSGITGMLVLITELDQTALSVLSLIYGVVSFLILDLYFIRKNSHYKSGVTEALMYHSIGFTGGGVSGLVDFDIHVTLLVFIALSVFAAVRYLDLVSTIVALGLTGYFIFFECYEMSAIIRSLIPFIFIVLFTPFYFFVRKIKQKPAAELWMNCLILTESFCLLVVYAAGNYLVVRELSVALMNLYLEPGEEIPFALIFYFLTVAIPLLYFIFGVRKKDVVLLRVSLLALAFSVFTFKYYYSFGHPEITLTISGALLLIVCYGLYHYLSVMRNGFTHENILSEKWASANPEAFLISQTMGGNKVTPPDSFDMGGGSFGGGGSGGNY